MHGTIGATLLVWGCLMIGTAAQSPAVHITPGVATDPAMAIAPAADPAATPALSPTPTPNRAPSAAPLSGAAIATPSTPRIDVKVDLVLVPVTVTDPLDRLVTGLDAEQFAVMEDKVPQKIQSFSSEDAPISVGVIFDSSGSMADKMAKSREALTQFFKTANPQDEFFLVDFEDQPYLLSDFTSNVDDLQNRVAFINAHGRTALLDAVYLALDKMHAAHNPRKALLIISDGGDNHSRYTEADVRNVVKEADVQIFAIGIFSPADSRATPEEMSGPGLLSGIAEASGGREFAVDDVNELPDIATKIGQELRNQYVLGYSPTNRSHNGKWRKIKVKVLPPPGLPALSLYAKAGYYAPAH